MNLLYLLENLNDKQREAVAAPRTNMLILAGAGSGKTKVLVYRIAWLLTIYKVSPFSIMVVTFTNKAAIEIRHRINTLLGDDKSGMWIGTFHGLAHRLLRIHYLDANLPQDFQILDSDDQYRLLRQIIKSINLDENKWPIHQAACYINAKKDGGFRPKCIENYSNSAELILLQIYKAYQKACDRAGLVDFSELLLRSHELWLNKTNILHHYCNRFNDILIDEFQDINGIQYDWIRILAGNMNKVMIVGDDDQSIYGWRGAQVENIQNFLQDFSYVKTIRLEQNYRSTKNILKSANALISNNDNRLLKNLWTKGVDGEPISIYCGFNDLDEAYYVIDRIKEWHNKGGALKKCAILYRSNWQSRIFEEALLKSSISYYIYGGQHFFHRQEIKDAISYLRLVVNHNDDTSFERIINTPTRGIGKKTLDIIRQTSCEKQLTLWNSSKYLLHKKIFSYRAEMAIKRFLELIDALSEETINMPLHTKTDRIIYNSGLFRMYEKEKGEKEKERIENLKELITATRQFSYQEENENLTPLQAFLSHITLESDKRYSNLYQDAVQLMTIHSAKGLEFPLVFIVGMEEGMFPSKASLKEDGCLAEERRLAYVGLTRAMEKLTITYAENRRLYGKEVCNRPSRFISELPPECIEEDRLHLIASRSIRYK
ncbi:MAG: DNA helicase II [Arsenophonus sp. ER-BJ3-MAG3]